MTGLDAEMLRGLAASAMVSLWMRSVVGRRNPLDILRGAILTGADVITEIRETDGTVVTLRASDLLRAIKGGDRDLRLSALVVLLEVCDATLREGLN